ncbi:MAG: hypothetical protein ACYDB7_15570, partial [Mycobacteriales bacterium]
GGCGAGMNPVRDGYATDSCRLCGAPLTGRVDQLWCSTRCRQRAWRQAGAAPAAPVVAAKSDTVYECPSCAARYLEEQRCPDCNTWCRRLGAGGPCPHCDELVVISDILAGEQLARQAVPSGRRAAR